jgi:hypothetical protein
VGSCLKIRTGLDHGSADELLLPIENDNLGSRRANVNSGKYSLRILHGIESICLSSLKRIIFWIQWP